jgi:hypothetical protein
MSIKKAFVIKEGPAPIGGEETPGQIVDRFLQEVGDKGYIQSPGSEWKHDMTRLVDEVHHLVRRLQRMMSQ